VEGWHRGLFKVYFQDLTRGSEKPRFSRIPDQDSNTGLTDPSVNVTASL
jgi:hypothetical protein